MNDSTTNTNTVPTPIFLGTVNGANINLLTLSCRSVDDMLTTMCDCRDNPDLNRMGTTLRASLTMARQSRDRLRDQQSALIEAIRPIFEEMIHDLIVDALDRRLDEIDIDHKVSEAVDEKSEHIEDAIRENLESELDDRISDKVKEEVPFYVEKSLKNARITLD